MSDLSFDDDDSELSDLRESEKNFLMEDSGSSSEKEEVLPIEEDLPDPTEQSVAASDTENETEDMPNEDAWGRKKSVYYNADFVDMDWGRSYREDDKEAAKAEERDALEIQRKYLKNVHSSAFETLSFAEKEPSVKSAIEVAAPDWKSINMSEKIKIVNKNWPEFIPIVSDFKNELTSMDDLFQKVHDLKKRKDTDGYSEYLALKKQIGLHYIMNVSFYIYMRASGTQVGHHPVLQKIQVFKSLLDKCEALNSKMKLKCDASKQKGKRKVGVSQREKSLLSEQAKQHKISANGKIEERLTTLETEDGENEKFDASTEKRAISFQIAKNKGLTPHRKKEFRNPRVRHRMKFKRAEIKRKGQVKTPRTEVRRYGGEVSGIHANVTRSIKIR